MLKYLKSNDYFNFRIVFLKYWRILLKPVILQTVLGSILGSAIMILIWQNIEIICFFFIFWGVLIIHIVYRCVFGENIQDVYFKDQ